MIKNENIICISSIDWDFVWQGHQEIMSTFAANGNRVLFIENTGVRSPRIMDVGRLKKRALNWLRSTKGFRMERENLFLFSPVVLPFPYSRIASWINRRLLIEPLKRWMKAMSFRDPIVWTFLPTGIAHDIIDEVYDLKLLVYYDIADFSELTDNQKKLKLSEEALIRRCDVVFAQGREIADRCLKHNQNVTIFPFGVNTKVFNEYAASKDKAVPPDLAPLKKPVIGYIGGIHRHVDIQFIVYLAKARPDWSIALVGPKQVDLKDLEGIPNVHILGKKDFVELPKYVDGFDAAIIPYHVSDYTNTVYPTKLNEYYAMGKPAISTALPEVISTNRDNGGLTYIAGSDQEFVSLVERALRDDSDELRKARIEWAGLNSWSDRIVRMSAIMESAINSKRYDKPADWQESFLRLYKRTKHGIIKMVSAAVLLYMLIFYTPLMWMLAKPLVISDMPRKADAIVVLGGGIGESGKVGQGYEERVEYAVDLYKSGYAGHIVFSSGYMYIFRETLVMKALAMSLGVPENAIILESRVTNTYDNVLAISGVLRERGWSRIILLSSPYHMLRVSKVFDKVSKATDVLYVPIPNGAFYQYPSHHLLAKKILPRQIEGIMHEYIGIVYYMWRGWI